MNIRKFFEYMHDIDFPYVVLRNFEGLPDTATVAGHGDLDLLVYDLDHFQEIFPDIKPVYPFPRVQHKGTFDGLNVYMDVRYVGDDYYPFDLEQAILESRVYNKNGFFTPSEGLFRIALAYHAVHHKNTNNYQKWLGPAKVEELLEALKKSDVGYVVPKDHTVGDYNQYWKGATSVVSRADGKIRKKQTSYTGYNLIDNEYRILSEIDGVHFPKVEKDGEEIVIEDCGDRINVDNLPTDWKQQLVKICHDLKGLDIVHRDIKPDNLMVKDDVVKLIDFGWAKYKDEKDNPPNCLGYPYKPSWGFDDNFSMKKVIKEIEYELEEKCQK